MKKRTLQSLGIAMVAAAPVPRQAQAWTVEVTGTIFDLPDGSPPSSDGFGLFGAANAALAGDSYTETITTDPFLNSTIQCATATCLGTAGANAPGDCSGLCLFTSLQALSSMTPFLPTLDFNQTLSVAGGFSYADTGSYTAFGVFDGQSSQETDFYGSIDTLSVTPKVGVPEPGTLPLLAAGLACIGFMRLRRRTRQSGVGAAGAVHCRSRTRTRDSLPVRRS
jgi:hypothetical protein